MARWGPPASLRAYGKMPAMQVGQMPPVEMDVELAHQLQEEEVVVEER